LENKFARSVVIIAKLSYFLPFSILFFVPTCFMH